MIDISNLRVSKNGRTICSVPRLKVASGERLAILGANGSGKTTLLKVLARLESEFEGDCGVNAAKKDCVYVHQSPYLFRGTVLFNVTYGLHQRNGNLDNYENLALDWLGRFGLKDRMKERVSHLSGGERRRVALARAMIVQPKLLLLDEPHTDLDEVGIECLATAI
ncbi:MAG: ABC transporter ATP-binding protein, partial [Planctomicrobium sp.]|nr:ABC transporter ATP-binding protein [Planctomicrobium sp.]